VVVVEIKIREMRKVGVRHGKGSVITGIVFRERNICVSAQRARKDVPANIEELQSIVGEKQLRRDAVERQRFSQKDVVHSICAIHLDLQPCVFAAVKLVNAIGGDIWRPPKLEWRHSLRELRVDPKNCVGWI